MCHDCNPAEKYSVICPSCGKYHPPLEIVGKLSEDKLQKLEDLTRSFRETRIELDATPMDDPLYYKLFMAACRLLQERVIILMEA